ncbi:MAG TPA: hypothetical protein VFN67_34610 [Polyangiales bacterium]|nr:hypothetical protein [Polyangiales bacterium]
MDIRLSDAAGESYHFKEQALLVSRLLRRPKESLPVQHVAISLGDTGAAAGLCGLVAAMIGRGRVAKSNLTWFMACAGAHAGMRAVLVVTRDSA